VSRTHSIPPFETAGMKKKTKKKKMKVGHFKKKISKGVRLEIFFANRVKKKKFYVVYVSKGSSRERMCK